MRHKTLLVVTFTLLTITPSYGQGIVRQQTGGYGQNVQGLTGDTTSLADLARAGGLIFFGGGEVPVRDQKTRVETALTALKTTLIYADAIIQALTGGGPENTTVGPMTGDFSEIAQDGFALTYGNDPSGALWNDTVVTMDHVFPEGGWNRNMLDRQRRAIKTQQRNAEILYRRFQDLPSDVSRKKELYDSVIGCEGRNCAIQALGTVAADTNQEQLVTQQILMAGFSQQGVFNAYVMNEQMARESQQYYFLSNGGTPEEGGGRVPPYPQFADVGLR